MYFVFWPLAVSPVHPFSCALAGYRAHVPRTHISCRITRSFHGATAVPSWCDARQLSSGLPLLAFLVGPNTYPPLPPCCSASKNPIQRVNSLELYASYFRTLASSLSKPLLVCSAITFAPP